MYELVLLKLIFRMVGEQSTWGAPRIHVELKMLGFDLSERTVLRWMRKDTAAGLETLEQEAHFLRNVSVPNQSSAKDLS
jgi:hypothetical protein